MNTHIPRVRWTRTLHATECERIVEARVPGLTARISMVGEHRKPAPEHLRSVTDTFHVCAVLKDDAGTTLSCLQDTYHGAVDGLLAAEDAIIRHKNRLGRRLRTRLLNEAMAKEELARIERDYGIPAGVQS